MDGVELMHWYPSTAHLIHIIYRESDTHSSDYMHRFLVAWVTSSNEATVNAEWIPFCRAPAHNSHITESEGARGRNKTHSRKKYPPGVPNNETWRQTTQYLEGERWKERKEIEKWTHSLHETRSWSPQRCYVSALDKNVTLAQSTVRVEIERGKSGGLDTPSP